MTRNYKKPQPRSGRVPPLKYRPLEKVPAGYGRSRRRTDKIPLDISLALELTNDDPSDYELWFAFNFGSSQTTNFAQNSIAASGPSKERQ